MHVLPNQVIMTPARVDFKVSRLWTLLKKNPRYWGNVGAVFMVVPLMAVATAYHEVHSPEAVWTRANPEPWQQYDHKQFKYRSDIDHEHYQHPRPRY